MEKKGIYYGYWVAGARYNHNPYIFFSSKIYAAWRMAEIAKQEGGSGGYLWKVLSSLDRPSFWGEFTAAEGGTRHRICNWGDHSAYHLMRDEEEHIKNALIEGACLGIICQ